MNEAKYIRKKIRMPGVSVKKDMGGTYNFYTNGSPGSVQPVAYTYKESQMLHWMGWFNEFHRAITGQVLFSESFTSIEEASALVSKALSNIVQGII